MKLLTKFNLIYVSVMAIGVAACTLISQNILRDNARVEVLDTARQLMDKANAVRNYTSTQITPLLATQLESEFVPQSVPSYSATEVLASLQTKHPNYFYKEATLNPTNPRDRAMGWEGDVVNQFRNGSGSLEVVGERDTPTGRSLFVARPIRITNGACLQCHSSVEAAPKTMVAKYGPANGFGWQLNEVIGAQIVSVPLQVALARADRSMTVFVASLVGIFVALGGVLNLTVWLVVVRPIQRLSVLAISVSQGDLNAAEFSTGSRDEIGSLAEAFARMRASVTQAIKMLDS